MTKTADKIILGVLALMLIGMGGVFITALSTDQATSQTSSNEITQEKAIQMALEAVPGVFQKVEIEDENGKDIYEVEIKEGTITKEVKISFSGKILSVEAEDDEETEIAITGTALKRASAAALAYIGEGRVTDSEIGDEEGYYEIEITLQNGNQVDVHLDESFKVLSTEYEDEED